MTMLRFISPHDTISLTCCGAAHHPVVRCTEQPRSEVCPVNLLGHHPLKQSQVAVLRTAVKGDRISMPGTRYHSKSRPNSPGVADESTLNILRTRRKRISYALTGSKDTKLTISDLGTTRSASSNDPALTKILPGIESGVE